MKKLLFMSVLIVAFFQFNIFCSNKFNTGIVNYINTYVGGQACSSIKVNKYKSVNAVLVENKCKILYSYNPPKTIMGISIVCIILFFVISKNFNLEYLSDD